jgi:outer membrane protein TolC
MITLICLTLEDYIKGVKKNYEVLAYRKIEKVYSYGFLSELSPEYPMLSYNAMFMDGAISLEQPIKISQPFKILSLRELKRAKRYEGMDLENSFVLSAVEAYLECGVLREKRGILGKLSDNLDNLIKLSEYQYKGGNLRLSEAKVIKAKMELINSKIRKVEGDLKRVEELVRFYYGGDVGEIFLPKVETLPNLDSLMKLLENSPRLKYREHIKRSKRYENFSKILPLTLSPGILYHDRKLSFSLSIELPIWILRYWGELNSSREEYKMEEYMYRAEREKRIAQIMGLYGDYISSLESLKSLENSLKEMERALNLERENYRSGRSNLYDVFMLYNEVLELEMEVVETKAEVLRKVYEIKGLVGIL